MNYDGNCTLYNTMLCILIQILDWLRKKKGKFTSHDIQNEILKLMALSACSARNCCQLSAYRALYNYG